MCTLLYSFTVILKVLLFRQAVSFSLALSFFQVVTVVFGGGGELWSHLILQKHLQHVLNWGNQLCVSMLRRNITGHAVWARAGGKQQKNLSRLAWRGIHVRVQAAFLADGAGRSLAYLGTRLSHGLVGIVWAVCFWATGPMHTGICGRAKRELTQMNNLWHSLETWDFGP